VIGRAGARSVVLLVAALLLGLVAPAAADPSEEDLRRARAYFEAGRALYSLGRYDDALKEFTAGYQLAPRPLFLINLGQSYRRLGRNDEAIAMYRRFMAEAPPNDPNRAEVERVVAELTNAPAAPPQSPAVVPRATAPAAPQERAPAVVAAAPTPGRPAFARRHWWIFPLAGVVVAGLAVGIYFAARPAGLNCGAAGLGCVDAGGGLR
jgi:tetratricopeptide (TPR) repeat protein